MDKILNLLEQDEIKEIISSKKIKQKRFEEIMEKCDLSDEEYCRLVDEIIKTGVEIEHMETEIDAKEEVYEDYYTEDIVNQYFHDISSYEVLTKENEIKIITKAKAGDKEAKEIIIMSNLRLVAKIALHYCKSGIYYLDLIQEGTIGLISAIDKFDISKGYKFSTYATWWIKKEIIDALKKKVNMIKIPNYIYLMNKKIQVFEENYINKNHSKPSIEEIEEGLGISKSDIVKVKKAVEMNMLNLKFSEIKDDEEGMGIKDYSTINEIDRDINDLQQKNRVSTLLNRLNIREKKIIEMYYGLSEDGKYTFKEIGKELNISAERVRVLKERALGKLRFAGERLWTE